MRQEWMIWPVMVAATVLLGIIAFVGYHGFRSPLRPLLIFRTGWSTTMRCFSAAPRASVAIALVIATGAALQLLSTAFPVVLGEKALIIASIAWQALMATAIAALAVFVHLFIIHDVFAERRFGAETHFYRGTLVHQSLHPRRPSLPLLFRAAGIGFGIWLISYGLQIAINVLVIFSPQYFGFAAPTIVQPIVYLGATFASFLITTLLSLVRPALSLGSRRPILLGIRTAVKRVPVLYVVMTLLLIAPALIGLLTVFLPHQLFPTSVLARVIGTVIFLAFSVFQTLAFEASTVFFMNRAMNQSTCLAEAELVGRDQSNRGAP